MDYREIDIEVFLKEMMDSHPLEDIVYITNPGNAGDSLIVYGTMHVFDKIGLDCEWGNHTSKYQNKVLIYAGAGNLVGLYQDCRTFLERNMKDNKIILLPCTVNNENELLGKLGDNVTIICRERMSYDYVKTLFKHPDNLYLSHDMAFHIDVDKKYLTGGSGTKNCFRIDRESKRTKVDKNGKKIAEVPANNTDYSVIYYTPGNTSNRKTIEKVCNSIFNSLSKFEEINTDRLHMSIAGALLGIKVNLYPGTYYKNRAIYEYSLSERYSGIKFCNYD